VKVINALGAVLLSLTLCQAQNSPGPRVAPDEPYIRQLAHLLTRLQKNPWQGWRAGTVVVVRYLGDDDPATKSFAYVQPDMVYQILETDKLFIRTQAVKGKPIRQDFLVKDQVGLAPANRAAKNAGVTDIELDGFTLAGLLSVLMREEFPGGSIITREWSLASHPSILLRKEVNGVGWRVTSARALKKIGEREFLCVEIKQRMRIFSGGPMDVMTTQYLSPDVPGHLVEEVQEFFKVGKKQERPAPYMVIHQRIVELKVQ